LYGSQNKQQLLPYTSSTEWFLYPRWRVFTERYALSPYIKQIRFVFKGLNLSCTVYQSCDTCGVRTRRWTLPVWCHSTVWCHSQSVQLCPVASLAETRTYAQEQATWRNSDAWSHYSQPASHVCGNCRQLRGRWDWQNLQATSSSSLYLRAFDWRILLP
jgi:hypothetical protein